MRFRAYLKATGRKAGPWMRTLAIRAMDEEAGRGDGSNQARELAEYIASLSTADQLRLLAAREQGVDTSPANECEQGGAA